MTPEPIFPKGEGPTPPPPTPGLLLPVDDGGKPKEPPGADGFAVETTFTVSEVVDNTGETQVEVFPGDVFGDAEAASPMMYPNLAEHGFVVPTFAGSRVSQTVSNIGATAWEILFFQRFIATKTVTITRVGIFLNCAAAMNAQSTLAYGIYNESGTQLLARTDAVQVNTLSNGQMEFGYQPLTSPTSLKLIAGRTYMMVQAAPGGRTNGMFVWSTDTTNFNLFQEAIIRANGGNAAVLADRLRYGLEGQIVYAADPGLPPADLTTPLPTTCSLQNSNAWLVAP